MKQKIKSFHRAVIRELKENRNTFLVYTGLRFLVFIVMIMQIFNKNYENVFLCILTLMLMIMPSVIQAAFKVEFPSPLEIILLIFIFAAEILGEISAFYLKFPYWDTILHTLNGFLCAAVGFSLVDIMNRQKKMQFELSPLFSAMVAFCFSMTIGVLWEFFEFGMDCIWRLDMQKDTVVNSISSVLFDPLQSNRPIQVNDIQNMAINGEKIDIAGYLDIGLFDTMYDLIVNFIGAITFSVMGYFYIKHRNSKSIVEGLVPEPWAEEKILQEKKYDEK